MLKSGLLLVWINTDLKTCKKVLLAHFVSWHNIKKAGLKQTHFFTFIVIVFLQLWGEFNNKKQYALLQQREFPAFEPNKNMSEETLVDPLDTNMTCVFASYYLVQNWLFNLQLQGEMDAVSSLWLMTSHKESA